MHQLYTNSTCGLLSRVRALFCASATLLEAVVEALAVEFSFPPSFPILPRRGGYGLITNSFGSLLPTAFVVRARSGPWPSWGIFTLCLHRWMPVYTAYLCMCVSVSAGMKIKKALTCAFSMCVCKALVWVFFGHFSEQGLARIILLLLLFYHCGDQETHYVIRLAGIFCSFRYGS